MTYLPEQIQINQNYYNGGLFNTYMDATGTGGFDLGKRLTRLQTPFLKWTLSSNIKQDTDFGRNEFANEYTMTSYSKNVGSTGIKVIGNPDILRDERRIYEQYVKIVSNDIATKFNTLHWEELKRILFLREQSLVTLQNRLDDLFSQHIGKQNKLITAWFLSQFDKQYSTYINGSTTPIPKKFSLQTDFLTDLNRNIDFKSLMEIPRMLMDAGKFEESDNNLQVFLGLPDIIFDALINKTLQTDPSQFNFVVGYGATQPLSYYKNGLEFELKNVTAAQSYKYECNLSTGISIRRMGKLESYQIWEQDAGKTIGGAKTFKCPMWVGNEGFKISRPTPNAVEELMSRPDPSRTIKPYGSHNIYLEERRASATQGKTEFGSNEYRALTRQCFVPLQLENACAFEIDAAAILGISQADLETKIANQYKPVYAETFYEADHMDENHDFLKPIV